VVRDLPDELRVRRKTGSATLLMVLATVGDIAASKYFTAA